MSGCAHSHKTTTSAQTPLTHTVGAGDYIALCTDKGFRILSGDEATQYESHQKWIIERLKEAQSIKVGTTYAELSKYFRADGGITFFPGPQRFDMILCPCIKVDVEFADKDGKKVGASSFSMPDDARVSTISKPYLEEQFLD
jgi:hypothetical protein